MVAPRPPCHRRSLNRPQVLGPAHSMRQRPTRTTSRCPGRNSLWKSLPKNACQVGKKKRKTDNWLYIIRLSHENLPGKVADPLFNPVRLNNRGKTPLSNARHTRAFSLFRRTRASQDSAASTAGRGVELTTNVYEIYCICVRNLLQKLVRDSSGPRKIKPKTRHFLTGKSALPLPLRTMPNDHRAPGLLTRK